MCIAQAADIFGTGLVAGAFVMGAFAVHPAAASLDPAPHVALRQELIRRLSRFLSPFMLLPVPGFTLRTGALSDIGCRGRSTHSDAHCPWPLLRSQWRSTRRSTDALGLGRQAHCIAIGKTMSVAGMWRMLFE